MSHRTEPSFFIVGAPKAGTSSLTAYLRQHPDLYLPDRKDVPFFGSDLDYRPPRPSRLEYEELYSAPSKRRRCGDACVLYLRSRMAPLEIAQWSPEARIFIMLRDPVEAMHSLHGHMCWMRTEDIEDFEEALAAEADRRRGRRIPPGSRSSSELQYRAVMTYSESVERYLDVFGNDHVQIILFDDLKRDAAGVVTEAFRFLEVDPGFTPELPIVNARKALRLKRLQDLAMRPPTRLLRAYNRIVPARFHGRLMPVLQRLNTQPGKGQRSLAPETAARLRRGADADVERLERLIGRDLSHWRASASSRGV